MLKTSEDLSQQEILRYSRHLLIPEVGLDGQEKLKTSSVLLIGTGGLGSPVAMYLAAAGVGRIGLVDFDRVDFSNLQRQIIHGTSAVDSLKVDSARDRILEINPLVEVDTHNEIFTSQNALEIADGYDLIVDGTDNFPTRYLVNDVCVKLGIPHVYASIYRFDGQASVFHASNGGPCYRCLFPEPPPPGSVPSCAEGGVLGVLPGTIGSIQASEAIKVLLGIGETLEGRLLLYNALDMRFDFVKLRKNPDCKVCSLEADAIELIDYEDFCGVPIMEEIQNSPNTEWEISPKELNEQLQNGNDVILIDVREPQELQISKLPNAELIPLGQFPGRMSELDSSKEMVIFCRSGARSGHAVDLLRAAGFTKVKNLVGGINDWARQVDPDMPLY
jgi:adenylyltransferase/sulfurtransferase